MVDLLLSCRATETFLLKLLFPQITKPKVRPLLATSIPR